MPVDIQTILVFILAVLAVNLVAVGVYIIIVLRDFRETIKKANTVLSNVNQVTDVVTDPAKVIAGILSGVTEGIRVVKSISSLIDEEKERKPKR